MPIGGGSYGGRGGAGGGIILLSMANLNMSGYIQADGEKMVKVAISQVLPLKMGSVLVAASLLGLKGSNGTVILSAEGGMARL